jgi:hypothetical protein
MVRICPRVQIRVFVALLSLFMSCVVPEARADSEEVIHAHVDSISVESGKLAASGWVASTSATRSFTAIRIWVGDTQVYSGPFERVERPDVASAMGESKWKWSGWRIESTAPYLLSQGEYVARAEVVASDGRVDRLDMPARIATLHIDAKDVAAVRDVWHIRLALALLAVFVLCVFCKAERLSSLASAAVPVPPAAVFGVAMLIAFALLLGLGATGSSFPLGLQSAAFIEANPVSVLGSDRGIRSDEWLVSTPLSLAQANHVPAFPVVNSNLGIDGQNMLIVGMTGSPVAHVTAIAKPATWGFFLFDTKRAMSWNWYFPVFACLLSLWGVLKTSCRCSWRRAFLLSLWFNCSAYVAAWSNWPAYAVMFPSVAFLLTVSILRGPRGTLSLLGIGVLLGVVLAGFVLVLYPPWQISLAFVYFGLLVGVVARDKLYLGFNLKTAVAFVLALSVSGVIVYSWWTDAHGAIRAMMDTVYPGQRMAITGGGTTLPQLLRGFTNTSTLKWEGMSFTNQSEIASFFYFLLPAAAALSWKVWKGSLDAVEVAVAAVVTWILVFMFVGIPLGLAELSLWSRVPPNRADIALGLANVILCGLVLSSRQRMPLSIASRVFVSVIALGWAAIVAKSILALNPIVAAYLPFEALVATCIAVAVASYSLVIGEFRTFIVLALGGSIAATWTFNPINIAPRSVSPASFLSTISGSNPRLLVLETQTPAMYYLASGMPVSNGVYYYPSRSLWARLDPDDKFSSVHNRYHHLLFSGLSASRPNPTIELTQVDVVTLFVDLERFDFRLTDAGLVASPPIHETLLRKNPKLVFVENRSGWSWFRVKGAAD